MVKEMDIKLIALDMDRTTLNSSGQLTDKTKTVLEEAINMGIKVVLATGRTYTSLPNDHFGIQGLEYIITSNGAHITKLDEEKIIYSNCIDENSIYEINELLIEHRTRPVEVFTRGRAYIEENIYYDIQKEDSKFAPYLDVPYALRTRSPIDGIYDFMLVNSKEIENINIHFVSEEEKRGFLPILGNLKNVTITSSMPTNIEIGGKTTSKAEALRELCEILGITKENVMAMGDSPNDITMIEWAKLGVAVENATPDVKERADYITSSNNEDGVAKAIEKFIFGR